MALTLQQHFGANAAINAGVLSITLANLSGVGLNGANPSPADIAAALVLFWKTNTPTDAANDKTIGVVVADSFSPKSFVTRGDESQIEYQYILSAYTSDSTSALDPDNVV